MNPVVTQPRYGAGGSTVSDWQTGTFDCCADIGICLCGTFFPLCLSCQIASDMNECCLCGASVAMRTLYRTRYGIPRRRQRRRRHPGSLFSPGSPVALHFGRPGKASIWPELPCTGKTSTAGLRTARDLREPPPRSRRQEKAAAAGVPDPLSRRRTTMEVVPAETQQLKTVQIAKKPRTPTSGPVITKLIFAKPINSKAVTGQTTQVSPPVIAGRVLSQSTPGTPSKTITISETGVIGSTLNSTTQTPNKIAISPLKSPNKAVKSAVQTITVGGVSTSQFKTIIPLATAPNVQQIQVPGSKFHYVRLVTATTASSSTQPVSQNPSTNTQPLQQAKPVVSTTPVRMSVPLTQTVKQVVPKPINPTSQIVTTSQPQQRLIMPATPLPQIQPNLTNLPPGTVLAPAPGTGNVGYAVLPAQYVTQLQQSSYVSIASSSNFTGTSGVQTQARLPFNGIIPSESASRPRKPCNCTKSLCLKLYCDCFANGEFCNNCNCTNCYNNLEHENERQKAIKACLDRNPEAFKPKIGKGKEGESDRRHSKGCNCKRSGCLKNYCECYEAKIMCSSICKCIGCKNFEESPERKTLMHLADAAEVRVQQQTAAKTKLSSQISDLLTRPTPALSSGGGKLPFTFVTKEVAEATCNCLLAQAEQADKKGKSKAAAERMILEEFGRCLMSVINSAGKAKSDPCAMNC
ncbi:Protein lin-54 like protein [Myotis brandtii]|uniref:Protein lin-54 homolog n=1 Tax=Myotis brandtii TaxID=109478 RepID=S7MD81_MYOBR|nr:Protein lin-54 like protein [Myotis brandtii]